MGIFDLLSGGFIGKLGDLAKVFFGDKSQRDASMSAEMRAVQEAYKAEFLAPERIGWWASFIDGINRMVRPFFTFGIVALFLWAVINPVRFQISMVALQAVPDLLWYIFLTVIGFWFGGRLIEKAPLNIKAASASTLKMLIAAQQQLKNISNSDNNTDGNSVPSNSKTEVTDIPEEPAVDNSSKITTKPSISTEHKPINHAGENH